MVQVNLYRNDRSNEWEIGTPLETWRRGRKKEYRFRPFGQDRGFDSGLMGTMADEANYHATEVRPLEISYEEALDQFLGRFLSDFEGGRIKADQSLKDSSCHPSDHFFSQWAEGETMYTCMGDTAKEALENLKNEVTTHIRKLKEDEGYRNFHVNEGGPTVNLFPELSATIQDAISKRKKARISAFAILAVGIGFSAAAYFIF